MSDYRRLISYIYAYEGGVKGRNIGFAKLEARGGQCKIQVSVRRIYVGNQDIGVYLLAPDKEILVGRIFLRGGSGEFRAVVPFDNVDGSGRGMDQCYGLTIHSTDDAWRCYTTIWEDAVAHAAAVELEEATSASAEAKEMEKLPPAEITEKSLARMDSAPRESVVESIEREIAAQPAMQGTTARSAAGERAAGSVTREAAVQPEAIPQAPQTEVTAAQPAAESSQASKLVSGIPRVLEPEASVTRPQPETSRTLQLETPVTYPQPETPRVPQPEGSVTRLQAIESSRGLQPGASAIRPQPEVPAAHLQVPHSSQPEASVLRSEPEALSQPQPGASRQSSGDSVSLDSSSGDTTSPASSAVLSGDVPSGGVPSGAIPSGSVPSPEGQPASQIPLPDQAAQPEPDRDDISRLWSHFQRHYPKIQAFDYHGGCEILLIKPQDIGLLPRETWAYGNNSFLLHGYYNHRYLILARLSSPDGVVRFLLGVPGHYYSNEKYMASMFGFPNFVLSKMQPAGDGRFGYWYTDIRLTEGDTNKA